MVEHHEGRVRTLKRLQRENTTEMILEPITGFSSNAYEIDENEISETEEVSMDRLTEIVERLATFYQDAALKTQFLPEVADVFESFVS